MKKSIPNQYQKYMDEIGLPIFHAIENLEIPKTFQKEEWNATEDEYRCFLQDLNDKITDEQIIKLSKVGNIEEFRPYVFAILCARNAREALDSFAKYMGVHGMTHIELEETPGMVRVRYVLDREDKSLPRSTTINAQLILLRLLRTGCRKNIVPISVVSPFDYGEVIENYIGRKTKKGPEAFIAFSNDDLELPFLTRNDLMREYLEPELKHISSDFVEKESFANVVEKEIETAFPDGSYSEKEIAEKLFTSVRTMQRKLSMEKTTFAEQTQKAQEWLIKKYLKESTMSVSEIAWKTGYADVSSLCRAFKKWTGKTPKEYRNGV